MNNKDILKRDKITKAMVSLPNISLTSEDADKFIDYIVDESALMQNARIIKMNEPTKNVRALGLGSARFLFRGDNFSNEEYKDSFSQNLIELVSKKVRGALVIHDDDIEDNPEKGKFVSHIMRMIADNVANELDETFWISDTAGLNALTTPDIRTLFDGWRYRITNSASGEDFENDVSGSAVILDGTSDFDTAGKVAEQDSSAPYAWEIKFQKMLTQLPSKYRIRTRDLRFFCNPIVIDDYIECLQDRGTVLGDRTITDDAKINFRGIPLVPVPQMATTLDGSGILAGGSYTDVLLTHKQNLVIGIQRAMRMESSREAADESTYIFYSMRSDLAIENIAACVLLEKITHSG